MLVWVSKRRTIYHMEQSCPMAKAGGELVQVDRSELSRVCRPCRYCYA